MKIVSHCLAVLTLPLVDGALEIKTKGPQTLVTLGSHRRLAQDPLVGYQPRSLITDHAAIDLDVQALQERAGFGQFPKALKVYEEGGHSGSYAEVRILNPKPNMAFSKGTAVVGFTEKDGDVLATLMEDASWGEVESVTVKILYTTSDVMSKHVDCMVGGLYSFMAGYRDGCLAGSGQLEFIPIANPDVATIFNYTYDIRADNKNFRTIQMFSTEAFKAMKNCPDSSIECFYDDFQLFVDYYGDTDYGNKWINAAANGTNTGFKTGRGNADFKDMVGTRGRGRAEAMTQGAIYLNVWMWAIRHMEVAVDNCNVECTPANKGFCYTDAIASWDQAFAYYAGSLEGSTGSGNGVLLYSLAEARAAEFKTAGYLSDQLQGTSYVNLELLHLFNKGQDILSARGQPTQCSELGAIKQKIVNLMKVPVIQTLYRYAWMRETIDENAERQEARGATFAAAILPYVHACKPSHATTLYNLMAVGTDPTKVSFSRVRSTLESLYPCLGVTCAQIGGIFRNGQYLDGAGPCFDGAPIVDRTPVDKSPPAANNGGSDSGSTNTGGGSNNGSTVGGSSTLQPMAPANKSGGSDAFVALGFSLAALMFVAILALVVLHVNARRQRAEDHEKNIAAVTAVSELDMA